MCVAKLCMYVCVANLCLYVCIAKLYTYVRYIREDPTPYTMGMRRSM